MIWRRPRFAGPVVLGNDKNRFLVIDFNDALNVNAESDLFQPKVIKANSEKRSF